MGNKYWKTKDERLIKIEEMTTEHLFNSERLLIKKFSLLVKEIQYCGPNSKLIQLKTIINEARVSLKENQPTSISSMTKERKEEMIYPLEIE